MSEHEMDWETWWVRKCEEYRRSIVRIHCGNTIGTGWIAGAGQDGFLVATARHVIRDLPKTQTLQLFLEGQTEPLTVTPSEDDVHHAHGKVDVSVFNVNHAPIAPSLLILAEEAKRQGALRVLIPPLGIEVGWIGFPETTLQVFGQPTATFCRGHISAVGQERRGEYIFCLDGNVNRGMSGGPVWDSRGAVMGIVTAYQGPQSQDVAWPGFGLVVATAYVYDTLMRAGVQPMTEDN